MGRLGYSVLLQNSLVSCFHFSALSVFREGYLCLQGVWPPYFLIKFWVSISCHLSISICISYKKEKNVECFYSCKPYILGFQWTNWFVMLISVTRVMSKTIGAARNTDCRQRHVMLSVLFNFEHMLKMWMWSLACHPIDICLREHLSRLCDVLLWSKQIVFPIWILTILQTENPE